MVEPAGDGVTDPRCPVCDRYLVDLGPDHGVMPEAAEIPEPAALGNGTGGRVGWLAASPAASIRESLRVPARTNPRPTPPPRPRLLGRPGTTPTRGTDYQLLGQLGQGGMGEVFSARQLALDRTVALKRLPEFGVTAEDRQRFRTEARITSSLDHPNIIPVYDLGEDAEGRPFFAMKLVQGRVWGACLHQLTESENLEILIKVCDGIAFAHAKGVIHGDLKPDNIMLGEFGEVLVMDWGLATRVEEIRRRGPEERFVSGTPAYLAPEMARADHTSIGFASDVYLLGGCLFEILTRETPHLGGDIRECLDLAIANRLSRDLPDGDLGEIARRALATRPEERHPGVKEFQTALRNYLGHAESSRLSQRATLNLATARSSGRHDDFSRAIAGHEQALILWPDNRQARIGLFEARLAFAQHALGTGDLELASALAEGVRDESPEAAETLLDQASEALEARRSTRARLRLLGTLVGIASFLVVAISVAAATLAHNERQAVVAAIRERDEAELRLAAIEHRGWESVIAENFNGERLPNALRVLQGRWSLDDRRLTARGPETCQVELAASGTGPLRLSFDLEHGGSLAVHLGVDQDGLAVHLESGGITLALTEQSAIARRGQEVLAQGPLPRSASSLARHVVIDAREYALEVLVDGRPAFPPLTGLSARSSPRSRIRLEARPGAALDNLRVDRYIAPGKAGAWEDIR